ncbi:Type IV secretion system protein virB9 precursor [Neisseria animaloris]|uniref:TrbG/VirB9 family P-type conjugative transfer protein n=1 Tax=Neisseria animaloris TaxID=326522 RepID=UPI000A1937DF|nr:TrbG/VirB9 family P-type conjugative transfer protein [Neisseria animaloris]OSI07410.1 type VI secretion protein [Neisseria animaloris]VEH87797.1 Type IV secretion system protein virB9 precursor [Neisseria animaloris]
MIKTTLLITGLMAGFSFQTATAAVNPKHSSYDKRIQYVNYNPYDVVVVRAKVGYVSMLQMEEGETVDVANPVNEGLVTGYGKAWSVSVRGNNIFFKPTKPQPVTNLLMVSSKNRRYLLDLKMSNQNHPPTYVLEFRYPKEVRKRQQAEMAKYANAEAVLRIEEVNNPVRKGYNFDYWGRGKKSLAPTEIYDNGRFTYFRFDNARDLPAVFRVKADGTEAAVNSHVEGDTLVVHETAKHFVLRLGKSVLGIENRSYNPKGKFNITGTTQSRTVRMKKEKK